MGMRIAIAGALTFGLIVLSLGLTSAAGAAPAAHSANVTAGTFNESLNAPAWNSGNLCNATKVGSQIWCSYNGPSMGRGFGPSVKSQCGCTQALSYNFSTDKKTIYISINNLSSRENTVELNFRGNQNTVYLNVSGCGGGVLNLTLLGEKNTVNVNYTVSSMQSTFRLFLDHNSFNAVYSGNNDQSITYFSGVGEKKDLCPYLNTSRTDTGTVSATGSWDVQGFVWANGLNYTSSVSWSSLTGTGFHNYVGYANVTELFCGWAAAPPCQTSHHGGWDPSNGARRAE